ncbi:MAG: putative enzyme of heme biosynthesis [Acidobacteria bacterium OLB17]|nr:MAG: putative enzyme of heme biosynthesis [Acidobacteria bacterium OLB17]MCZ2390043.1 tetratricopeptide repeat protein [Acidobacteriota bacterium]
MYNLECHGRRKFALLFAVVAISFTLLASCGRTTEAFIAKGEEYLAKRKFHDALMQFRAAVESDSSSSRAHWGLARSYENLGEFDEAFNELRKATELDPNNLDAQARLGNYFLLVKPPLISEAQKVRDLIAKKDPKFIEGCVLEASILNASGRGEDEVVAKLNEAIALDPKRTATYVSLSRYYTTIDKPEKAENALLQGIAADPSAALGYTEYGRFLMYAKRDQEAEVQFEKAIAAEPSNIEARETEADFFVASSQYEKAEAAYKKLVEIQENSPESRLELADFYRKVKRVPDALNVLNAVVAESPQYVRARYALAEIYLDSKDEGKVEEQVNTLLGLNDKDEEALMLLARLRLMQGRPEDAIKQLEEILKRTPSKREALYVMAQAKIAAGLIDEANAFIGDLQRYHPEFLKAGLLKIQAAFAAGDNAAALRLANELYGTVNTSQPNSETSVADIAELQLRSLSARGLAALALGRTKDAVADLERVRSITPNAPSALINLAKAYRRVDRLDEAATLYKAAMQADERDFDAVSGYISLCIETKQAADAYSTLNAMADRNAGRADVLAALHFLRSQVLTFEGKSAESEAELTAAIQLDPDYLPAYSAYAAMLARRNEIPRAIEEYKKVISARPSASIYSMLGILEDARGNTAEAEKNYRSALELAPNSPVAANNLAWLIAENQGNLDEALSLASSAVSGDQSVAAYYDTLGWVYLKKNLYSAAEQQFRKAIETDQKNGNAPSASYRVHLGMALSSSGNAEAARREAEASLKDRSGLNDQEVAMARRILEAR